MVSSADIVTVHVPLSDKTCVLAETLDPLPAGRLLAATSLSRYEIKDEVDGDVMQMTMLDECASCMSFTTLPHLQNQC